MAEAFGTWLIEVGMGLENAVGAFLISNASVIAYSSLIVGSIAAGRTMQRRAEAKLRNQQNSLLQDRSQVLKSGSAPSPKVYGRTLIGGILAHAQSTGSLGQYLHLVIAHVRHECDGIETYFFNEDELPQENVTTGFIESGKYVKRTRRAKMEVVTANGSGVVTTSQTMVNFIGLSPGRAAIENGYTLESVSVTVPTNTISGLTPGNSYVVTYEWDEIKPLVRIRRHLGQVGQLADADLVSESGGEWTSTDVGVSTCYTYFRIEFDQDVFGSIGIPQPSVVLRGMKVYDPRTATTVWSRNPQLCACHHLLDPMFGLRSEASEVVFSEQIAYANVCDEEVPIFNSGTASVTNGSKVVSITGTVWQKTVRPGMRFIGPDNVRNEIVRVWEPGGVGTGWRIQLTSNYSGSTNATVSYSIIQRRYETNGSLGSENSVWDNFLAILESMAGNGVYAQGRWVVQPGMFPTAPFTITEAFLGGKPIRTVPHKGRRETFNGVRGKFLDAFSRYVNTDYPAVTSSTYEAQDLGERILADKDFVLVDNHVQCQRLAKIELLQARQDLTIELSTNLRAYNLLPGSNVLMNIAAYGFANKPFLVLTREYGFEVDINYVFQETAPEIFDWAFNEATSKDPAPNSTLQVSDYVPSPLTILNVVSGPTNVTRGTDGTIVVRAVVTWNPTTDAFVKFGGRIEMEWMQAVATTWNRLGPMAGDEVSASILGLPDNVPIFVRVRAVTGLGKASLWTYWAHQVSAKNQAPTAVTGHTATPAPGAAVIRWSPSTDPDYGGTEWRVGSSFAAGTRIFRGLADKFDWIGATTTAQTIWGRNFDTSGNPSTDVSLAASALALQPEINADFDNDKDGWTGIVSVGTDSTASAGKYGVYTTSGGTGPLAYPRAIPVSTDRTYRVRARLQTMGGSTPGIVYIGAVCFDTAGNQLITTFSGSDWHPYCAAISQPLLLDGKWHTFEGTITGTQPQNSNPTNPNKFYAGTVRAAPFLITEFGSSWSIAVDYLTIEDITDELASAARGFQPFRLWDFNNSLEGWSSARSTLTALPTYMSTVATANDPTLVSPEVSFFGGQYPIIRARVKRAAGTDWNGQVFYTTPDHSESSSFTKIVGSSVGSDWAVVEWDMGDLSAGGNDWVNSQILQFRIDLGALTSDAFLVDWIAVGRYAPPVDLQRVENSVWVARKVTVVGNTAQKTAGVNDAWDADVYSLDNYAAGCAASAVPGNLSNMMFGLNLDPATDSSYTSLDHAILFTPGGAVKVYESGAEMATIAASYAPGVDVFVVLYNGYQVKYFVNGVLGYTSAVTGFNKKFFFDTSLATMGAKLTHMAFVPLSEVANINTPQIVNDAITQVAEYSNATSVDVPYDGTSNLFEVASLTYTSTGVDTRINIVAKMSLTYTGATNISTPLLLVKGALLEGNVVPGVRAAVFANAGVPVSLSVPMLRSDTPAAGSVTYRLAVRKKSLTTDTYSVSEIIMIASERKK